MINKRNFVSISSASSRVLIVLAFGLLVSGYILLLLLLGHSPEKEISLRFERHEEKTGYVYQRYVHDDVKALQRRLENYENKISSMRQREIAIRKRLQESEREKGKQEAIDNISLKTLLKTVANLTQKVDSILKLNTQSNTHAHDDKARVTNLKDIKKCSDPFVLFIVTSHSSNFNRRQSIRQTWGNKDKFKRLLNVANITYDVYFSVGTGKNKNAIDKTQAESREHGDLLIINRQEDFYDLTRRVMAAFQWSAENCNNTYLFKVDDDVFVNIPNAMTFLLENAWVGNVDNLFAGDMNMEAVVNRDRTSKYFVDYNEWPVETYPPYCSGGGFILSRTIIEKIIPLYDWSNPYKIDDVYIGILVQRAKDEKIFFYVPTDKYQFWFYNKRKACPFYSTSIVFHKVTEHSCMFNMTLSSTHQIGNATRTIDQFNKGPPSLDMLPKAAVPSGFIQKITRTSILDREKKETYD